MSGTALLVICVAGASVGAWVVYLRWKDKAHPEPPVIIAGSLVAGALSIGAGLMGYRVLDGVGRTVSWGALSGPWSEAIPTALAIGMVEESAKLLPASASPMRCWAAAGGRSPRGWALQPRCTAPTTCSSHSRGCTCWRRGSSAGSGCGCSGSGAIW